MLLLAAGIVEPECPLVFKRMCVVCAVCVFGRSYFSVFWLSGRLFYFAVALSDHTARTKPTSDVWRASHRQESQLATFRVYFVVVQVLKLERMPAMQIGTNNVKKRLVRKGRDYSFVAWRRARNAN